jgi:hypothetical protein
VPSTVCFACESGWGDFAANYDRNGRAGSSGERELSCRGYALLESAAGRIIRSGTPPIRTLGRGESIYDPWHYVPVLARKPGALHNGARFKDWVLPAALERVRRKLANADDGNRQVASGASRPSSHITSTLRPASRLSRRLD